MSDHPFDPALTALVIVDPYNDFISEGGKLWPRVKGVMEEVNTLTNMKRVLVAAREAGVRIFFAPHHRWRETDGLTWQNVIPSQQSAIAAKLFAAGTWGGTFKDEFQPKAGDVVAQEHWGSSGFANTDLDLQLKKYGLHQLVIMGLRANTCIESTVRFAVELGYQVTLLKDAIASFSMEEMYGVIEVNLPSYAHAILSTEEFLAQLDAGNTAGM